MRSERRDATVDLGETAPAGSRHQGRRSAVAFTRNHVVAGTADGDLVAFDRDSLDEAWQAAVAPDDAAVVSLVAADGTVLVGTRGTHGVITAFDAETGERRWSYDAADDVGAPQKDARFFLPFVVSAVSDESRWYVAARRYERDRDGDRRFESRVYAFETDGRVTWTFDADASPISLDASEGRVAVAYNRCPGAHHDGLVVLDAADGSERWRWDPGTDGQRRVGDVGLAADGAVATSHGDYRGYRLADGGTEEWRVDLATKRAVDGETVYAYPNHVHATAEGAVFVTGNTYPEVGRQTDVRHPDEHTAVGVSLSDGETQWRTAVGGFASGVATAGSRLAVPGAQNFREREAEDHGCCVVDVADGVVESFSTDGIAAAAGLEADAVAVVEEPVVYHDEGTEHGAYRLHHRHVS